MSKKYFKSIIFSLCLALILPLVANTTVFAAEQPNVSGASALTMDLDTGEIIYSKNANEERSPASTTKLLTSLLFAENKKKTDLIPYTEVSASLTETTLNTNFMGGTVKAGDTMTADDVMKAVLIFSANDAAIMMAESVSGSVDKFSDLMNQKAQELGATNSHFINPNGLEVDAKTHNVTTAYDLALIAKAAYQNDWVREVMSLSNATLTLNGDKIMIDTRNKNLGKDGNVGGKTGTETMAGHCFVGYYNKDGRNLVTVVLGADYGADGLNVFNDTSSIADYSYDAKKINYKAKGDIIGDVTLNYKLFKFFGPERQITVPLILDQDIQYYDNDFNKENAKIDLASTDMDAWTAATHKTADLTFSVGSYSETVTGSIQLSIGELLKSNIAIYSLTVLIIVIVIVLIIVLIKVIINSKKRRGRNRYYR